jgi:hypothetical protein
VSFVIKVVLLLLTLGAFGVYTSSDSTVAPDGGAPQTLDDGNPPPPKP